jgi:hypothetical protein
VDDQLIGGFEMPATVPILALGPSKIELRPGVILNGISSTRAPYPYFEPIIYEDRQLTPDSIVNLHNIQTAYRDNTDFIWMEDFEDAALAIKPFSQSDTGIYRTDPAAHPDAFTQGGSEYSGVVYLDGERPWMLLKSNDGNDSGFPLGQGDFIFLELHFKSDIDMVVGMLIEQFDGTLKQRPYIGLNATDEWKKFYLNFTPLVNEEVGAREFTVYFESYHDDTQSTSRVFLDNIKLLSRQNL